MSAGATLGASLGAAQIQSDTAKYTQQKDQDFRLAMTQRGENSYVEAGLPKFMYYGGSSGPNTKYQLNGNNFYEGSGVNSNLPYFSSSTPYSQFLHGGKPDQKALSTRQENTVIHGGTEQNPTSGQTGRTGLGSGLYSAVPPPNLTYNSVGTGTNLRSTDKYTQAGSSTRNTYAQTFESGLDWTRGKNYVSIQSQAQYPGTSRFR